MDKRTELIAGANSTFEHEGFRGIGIDRLLAPSGTSTRTLYKHFGSRDGLVIAVLEARHGAFIERLAAEDDDADPIGALFRTLRHWSQERGTHGCMLLRARGEYAGANEDIVALVRQQKQAFRIEIGRRVERALGCADATLATQIWLLFEGATAAASVADLSVIEAAESAASALSTGIERPAL